MTRLHVTGTGPFDDLPRLKLISQGPNGAEFEFHGEVNVAVMNDEPLVVTSNHGGVVTTFRIETATRHLQRTEEKKP